MDDLIEKVNSYAGYDEHWHDGRLYIEYHGAQSHELRFDGAKRSVCEDVDAQAREYFISAAVFSDARQSCESFGYVPDKIYEFLPEDRSGLIPAELFRLLMDDCGLGIDEATDTLVRCFGAMLLAHSENDRLLQLQPRTAFLEKVLEDALKARPLAFHDAYDAAFRSPLGAVESGESVTLRLVQFGGVHSAQLILYGDERREEFPMQPDGGYFTARITAPEPSALFYTFKLNGGEAYLVPDPDGHTSRLSGSEGGFRLTVYECGFETPAWFRRSIMYQVFPDRFGFSDDGTAQCGIEYHRALGQTPQLHGSISEPVKWQPRDGERDYAPDDFYGGTLRGICRRLAYLKSLGVGTLYLNPIVEARSNHRYDTANYEKVDPILGSVEDYVNLCDEAKRLGISVINDGVFSHTGADSIYFDRFGSYGGGAYTDKNSPFFKWFDFRSYPDDYRCWWNFRDLPEVNEEDKGWQDYIISGADSIVKLWLRRGGRGWRLDVADELPDDVLALIRSAAKSEKSDSVIIGEVWEDAVLKVSYGKRRNYALGGALDSVMNYPFRTAVIAFARGSLSAFELRDALRQQQFNYPAPLYAALMNLLSSHDVERLHTALGADLSNVKSLTRPEQAALRLSPEQSRRADRLQMLCAVIQYCSPGVPCLYYGDEECLDGAGDPFCRAPFEPSGKGLHNFYARLGEIRNSSEALMSGSVVFKAPSPDVFIIGREAENDRIVCVINRGSTEYKTHLGNCSALLGDCESGIVPPCSAQIFKLT